ncbi:hypothetical protein F2Q68_00026900 [Brassica cretica]|uniref:Uncharacterized protein n=1 Tax=Brassica cretica TaxID=69181 RepID=A0A8S9IBS4_BRACR|nr:hypothetical protein F2Q68_00026900 [Brassica cretica]
MFFYLQEWSFFKPPETANSLSTEDEDPAPATSSLATVTACISQVCCLLLLDLLIFDPPPELLVFLAPEPELLFFLDPPLEVLLLCTEKVNKE